MVKRLNCLASQYRRPGGHGFKRNESKVIIANPGLRCQYLRLKIILSTRMYTDTAQAGIKKTWTQKDRNEFVFK